MADEAFALSPISARARLPSEEDYDAISHAFMETSRGRWFLGEYAKRNRNADTRMVLDAVERIEQTIAAERRPGAGDRLPEAFGRLPARGRRGGGHCGRRRRKPRVRGKSGADPQGRADHPGNLLAVAGNRRR